jgi:hypothetical protein
MMKTITRATTVATVLGLVISCSAVLSADGVTRAAAAPLCGPGQLLVTPGTASPGAPTVGTASYYLKIKITNIGGTCRIGGSPIIMPIGVQKKSGAVVPARLTVSQSNVYTLKRGQSVFTVLGYWWTLPGTAGRSAWLKWCAPSKATGFVITISNGSRLLNRRVNYVLPEVCTTGQSNMSAQVLTDRIP